MKLTPTIKLIGKATVSFLNKLILLLIELFCIPIINIKNHKYSDSLLIGFSQAFAIIPGVSRSGVTNSSALISGWERGDAAKFSFLLGCQLSPSLRLLSLFLLLMNFFHWVSSLFLLALLQHFCHLY